MARWRRPSGRWARAASSRGRRRSTTRAATSPRKPVYLPLVHQLVKYLAQFESPRSWLTVGQVVDVSALTKARANWLVVTPSGKRVHVHRARSS